MKTRIIQNLDKDSEPIESLIVKNEKSGRKFTVNKLHGKRDSSSCFLHLGLVFTHFSTLEIQMMLNLVSSEIHTVRMREQRRKDWKRRGPESLRRRHGKRMDKKKLKRRSSINGHWYDRETAVSSSQTHGHVCLSAARRGPEEVVATLLEKYKIESSLGTTASTWTRRRERSTGWGPGEPLTQSLQGPMRSWSSGWRLEYTLRLKQDRDTSLRRIERLPLDTRVASRMIVKVKTSPFKWKCDELCLTIIYIQYK